MSFSAITTLEAHRIANERQEARSEEEGLQIRALRLREEKLGLDHPDVCRPLHALANLYRDRAQHDDAEPLYERALALLETRVQPDHPDLVELKEDYATFLLASARGAGVGRLFVA